MPDQANAGVVIAVGPAGPAVIVGTGAGVEMRMSERRASAVSSTAGVRDARLAWTMRTNQRRRRSSARSIAAVAVRAG